MNETAISGNSGKTRALVEGALCVALSVVFSYLKLFSMPQGGSITLEMAPLLYFSYKYRYKWGVTAGMAAGLIQVVFEGLRHMVHPVQLILDYPAAFACMGLAGCFGENGKGVIAGTALAIVSRLICHVLSGVIFFAEYAPEGQNPWVYSVIYNASYMVPSAIITSIAAWVIWKKFLQNTDNASNYS
jgi:thiamine transporter